MQNGIHPKYEYAEAKCACGNEFETRATTPLIKVDICSACHPFYTGQQKLVDAAGRVDRFSKRFSKTQGKTVARNVQKQKRISAAPKTPKGKILTSTPTKKKSKEDKK